MPMMISLRNFLLHTRHGHAIAFKPKIPSYVPDDCIEDAVSKGCTYADEDKRPFIDDLEAKKVSFVGTLRKSIIMLAIERLVKENSASNFDGAGMPKLEAVKKIVQFDVTKDERNEANRDVRTAMSTGEPYEHHPDAVAVLSVIETNDYAKIMAHARVGDSNVEGLSTADLKKYILLQYNGLAPS